MPSKVKQPKKLFKVVYVGENCGRKELEDYLNEGYLVVTDLVDALTNTNFLILVKNE